MKLSQPSRTRMRLPYSFRNEDISKLQMSQGRNHIKIRKHFNFHCQNNENSTYQKLCNKTKARFERNL